MIVDILGHTIVVMVIMIVTSYFVYCIGHYVGYAKGYEAAVEDRREVERMLTKDLLG